MTSVMLSGVTRGGGLSLWDCGAAAAGDGSSVSINQEKLPNLVHFSAITSSTAAAASDGLGKSTWNWDTSALANPIKGCKAVLLTTLSAGSSASAAAVSTKIEIPILKGSIQALAFTHKTMKLLAIGLESKVILYDLSHQKVRKELAFYQQQQQQSGHRQNQRLTCLAVNAKDSHLAVGCNDGTLHVLNAISGVASAPVISKKPAYMEALAYNPWRASMLAGCDESGAVTLWDCNANKAVQTFSGHRAPASGLVFSPINNTLIVSAGLDKKCNFYDSQSKRQLSSIKTSDPLTSLDMNQDGLTLALGDTKGQISVYDLRSTRDPLCSFKAATAAAASGQGHQAAAAAAKNATVSDLSFMPRTAGGDQLVSRRGGSKGQNRNRNVLNNEAKENVAASRPLPASSSATTKVLTPSSSSIHPDVTSESPLTTPARSKDDSINSLFSPIRDSPVPVFQSVASSGLGGSQMAPSVSVSSLRRASTDSVFSPLKEQSFNISGGGGGLQLSKDSGLLNGGSYCRTPKTAPSSNFNSPLTCIREEGPISPVKGLAQSPSLVGEKQLSIAKQFANEDSDDTDFQRKTDAKSELQSKVSEKESILNYNRPACMRTDSPKINRPSVSAMEFTDTSSPRVPPPPPAPQPQPTTPSAVHGVQTSYGGSGGDPMLSKSCSQTSIASEQQPSQMSDIRAMLLAFPKMMSSSSASVAAAALPSGATFSPPPNASAGSSGGGGEELKKLGGGGQPENGDSQMQLHRDYLRGMQCEALDDFYTDIKRHLWHLDYTLVRNFQDVHDHLEEVREDFRIQNEQLMAENQRLREENESLKKTRRFYQEPH